MGENQLVLDADLILGRACAMRLCIISDSICLQMRSKVMLFQFSHLELHNGLSLGASQFNLSPILMARFFSGNLFFSSISFNLRFHLIFLNKYNTAITKKKRGLAENAFKSKKVISFLRKVYCYYVDIIDFNLMQLQT